MNPGQELLLAIIKQALRDYMKLDPDSDSVSAEFHENEGADYKTAEDFLYNESPIAFGDLLLTYEDSCNILGIRHKKVKALVAREAKEY